MRLVALALAFGCGQAPPPPVSSNATNATPVAVHRCAPPSPGLAKLAEAIDVDTDVLHNDYTPAVFALIAAGRPGACAVADLLTAASGATRLHAQRVFEGVLAAEQGFVEGHGFHDQYGEDTAGQITTSIGYDYSAPTARSAAAWRHWLDLESRTIVDGGGLYPAAGRHGSIDGPTREAMKSALDAVSPQLRACGEPAVVTVTFDRSGRVASIFNEAITDASYRACLTAATAAIQLPAFHRRSVWTKWP